MLRKGDSARRQKNVGTSPDVCQWTGSFTQKIMACRQFGYPPIHEPMLTYFKLIYIYLKGPSKYFGETFINTINISFQKDAFETLYVKLKAISLKS